MLKEQWEYNQTSTRESLQELKCPCIYTKKGEKLDWKDRTKCEHFWEVYHAKWAQYFKANPEIWYPNKPLTN